MYILVIWAVIGFAGTGTMTHEKMGWRPIGEFSTQETCHAGGLLLNVKPEAIRCLKK